MIPQKTTVIEQRALWRGSQKLEILSDGNLEITIRRFLLHNQFKVPLWQLNPNPTRLKFMRRDTLVGLGALGILSIASFIGVLSIWKQDGATAAAVGVLSIVLLLFFLVVLKSFVQTSVNATVFYFRTSKGQIHVWFGKPNIHTASSFCETLTTGATEAWNSRPVDPASNSLAGELAALKKLRDNGVLTPEEFERAKAKLLEQEEKRTIGFK